MKNKLQMKKGLALFGQGKWKSALGHTLLIIGMVLMSFGAYAQKPTNGLYMYKTWHPDTENCPTGDCGYIRLETFVEGHATVTHAAVPSDIVVVVDQSTSMSYSMSNGQGGTTTRLAALQEALEGFVESVHQDAIDNNCDHRIAIVGFGAMPGGYSANGTYGNNFTQTTNTELLTPSTIAYNSITTQNYKDALLYVNTTNGYNTLLDAVGNTDDNGGTMMSYGLEMAYQILDNRDITTFDPDNDPTTPNSQPRKQIVVFFTDGYPGIWYPDYEWQEGDWWSGYTTYTTARFAEYNPNYRYGSQAGNDRNDICETEANNAVVKARALKQKGATVFTIGIFDGADPTSAYQTEKKAYRPDGGTQNNRILYYYWEPSNWTYTQNGPNSGDAAANGLMHFISSNYSADETTGNTPWSNMITATHNAGDHNNGKYLAASNAAQLASIFESIAAESGGTPIEMGAGTVVQDEVAASFQLDLGDDENPKSIKAYAPKCTGINANGEYTFETETDGTPRLVIGTDQEGNEGVVIGGAENRLPDDVVSYNSTTKTLTFDGFNFKAMYVAQKEENGHPINEFRGRKLVILIPLAIEDGSWGDGILTNGPMSVIFPDGSTDTLYFNQPYANVLGSVWTEVITTRPNGFPAATGDGSNQTVDIDSPEDLAWFISEVNGRIGYNVHEGEANTNNVASHPKLNGRLTADVDMSRHNWVPIGCGWQVEIDSETGLTTFKKDANGNKIPMAYEGTFDGNGHVITGLKNNASKYYKQIEGNQGAVVVFPGMFSDVKGTVKNVFVLDADFRGKHHSEFFVHHGIIADTVSEGGTIFNCEAAGRITCNNDPTTINADAELIYGGLVGLNEGTVHSCMAMAELTGYTLGGMIGENRSTFYNGFTNGVYNYLDNGITGKYAGGIAGKSTGTIDNCYVRFQRSNTNLDKVTFGQIAGMGSYTLSYSPEDLGGTVPTNSTAGNRTYTHAEPSQWIVPTWHDNTLDDTRDKMVEKLTANKGTNGTPWKRTTAGGYQKSLHGGNINGDYPVLAIEKFGTEENDPMVTCLGSADGIRIDYATSLIDMLHRHNNGNMNENTQISNAYSANNTNDYYKVTEHKSIYKGTINLYRNDDVTLPQSGGKDGVADNCTAEGIVVYIDENISLLQDLSSVITAYTGQRLATFGGKWNDAQAGNRWHNVSSSLQNSQIGWTYGTSGQVLHNWEARPCQHTFNQTDDDVALFPTDMGYHNADLYCFFEPQYHWINFRRNGQSHWHMDLIDDSQPASDPYNHEWIDYYYYNKNGNGFSEVHDNETQLLPGKGYLMAINPLPYDTVAGTSHLIQNLGTLNNGNVDIPVTYSDYNEWTGLAGYNLIGNPYQSFLDFNAFVTGNSGLWANSNFANTYGIFDPSEGNYIQYAARSSKGSRTAGQFINMHQGFFIQVKAEGIAHFTNDMRTNDATPNFRGEQPTYPLINFILTDNEGNTDIAVLEVDRPENDGAKKLRMGSPAGRIYFRYNDEDLGVYFRNSEKDYQTLYFAAKEDGNFTLNWERANDSFNSLTLVDNITGVKTDMLTHDHYTFEGRNDDYTTRFKIVFGNSNNEEEEEGTTIENFAFFNNGNLIVNGEGRLDVIDVLGRIVYSTELTDTQNTVSLPQNAKGVCMLRLTNGDNVKVQKMFVR